MDKLRILVCLVIWVGFVFAQGLGKDSLKIDLLKRQKLFYSSNNNWIPPTLPSEPSCVEVGCCLLPISGCLIGYGVIKKESQPESLKFQESLAFKRKLGVGFEYSLGLAATGIGYPKGGMELFDPRKLHYWVNHINIRNTCAFPNFWEFAIGIGYLWGEMSGRGPVFKPIDGYFCGNADWEMSSISPAILVKKNWGKKYEKFVEFGLEYHFVRGINYEKRAYTFTPVTITTWGQSVGGILGFGVEKRLSNRVGWYLTFLTRVGWITNPQYTATEQVVRDATFCLNFTGIYLKMGLDYLIPKIF